MDQLRNGAVVKGGGRCYSARPSPAFTTGQILKDDANNLSSSSDIFFMPVNIRTHTVKKFDEVVRHLHLVTQDQFSLVSKKRFRHP
jgi:hypothetical protein